MEVSNSWVFSERAWQGNSIENPGTLDDRLRWMRGVTRDEWTKERLSVWFEPLVAYFVFVVFLVAATLVVSYLLGQRHSESATGEPYEGGIVSEGSARVRLSVR